jgi:CHAD domain-containing protein
MPDPPSESGGMLARHLNSVVEQRLKKLVKSVKDSYLERTVDTVHDLRVASRRLRAFVVTFSDGLGHKARTRLERKLKRVTKSVAALRDLDVLVALVEERSAGATSDLERASLEHLLETLQEGRALAAARAETRLQELDLDTLCDLVRSAARDVIGGLVPEEGQRAYARSLLERLILAAAEREPPRDGAEHAEQLHCLRIALKELRYALEFLEPMLGAHFGLLYARAEALQELLGTHHDLTVLAEIVAQRGGDLARRNRPALTAGLELAGAALRAERQAVLERVRSRGFDGDWWRSALSLALEAG